MQVTSKLKCVEKLYRKQYAPKLRFYHFSPKCRKNNLNIQYLYPLQPDKMQIQHGALFLQFSIYAEPKLKKKKKKKTL